MKMSVQLEQGKIVEKVFPKNNKFLWLQEVVRNITSPHDLAHTLKTILVEIMEQVSAERGFIALTDDQGQLKLETNVSHNVFLEYNRHKTVFANSVVQQVIQSRANVFLLNTENEPRSHPADDIAQLGLKSVLCAPLLFGQKLVGVLYIDSQTPLTDFSGVDRTFFACLAGLATIAIENVNLTRQAQLSPQQQTTENQEIETRYRQLIEVSPEGIIVHSQGKIVFVNSTAVKLFGAKKPEDLLEQPIIERVHPHFRDIFLERIRMQETGMAVPPLEEIFLRLDGSAVDVEVVGAPFIYQGQTASLVLARNISRRKRLEQALLRAQKLESVGVLAGGIAHDFNNILQVIRGNALMAKANPTDQENVELCLTAIEKAVLHAISLTSQLLTFSKGGAPVTRSTSIQTLIQESVAFALRGSDVACVFDFADDLYFVEVNSEQINQVIHNIVLNADQAMPNGGKIIISAANVEVTNIHSKYRGLRKGHYVKISIKDQGIGMPQDILDKIFDPYFTTKSDGTGLGLTSCYSIITRHSGLIEVESEENKGSTFTLYLPASSKPPEKIEEDFDTDQISAKILVMDDNAMVRDTASRMLQRIGGNVKLATDGAEAIALYLQAKETGQPFDLVIFDLTVPGGMGGKEAIEKLREVDPEIKAIVASGYSHDPVMANPEQYGFRGVISKPFDIANLSKILKEIL